MVNYLNGKIYKIVSNCSDKIYIGSTTKLRLCDRMAEHRADLKRYNNGTHGYVSSTEILNYGDAKIVLIENYPCNTKDDLKARENHWQELFKDICVNWIKAYRSPTAKTNYMNNYNEKRKAVKNSNCSQKYYECLKVCDVCCGIYSTSKKIYIENHHKNKRHTKCDRMTQSINLINDEYCKLFYTS